MEEQGKFFDIEQELWDPEYWRTCGRRAMRARGTGTRAASERDWYIGDWLLAGKKKFKGNLREEARKATGIPWGTLKNFMGLAKEFPKSRRRDFLSWSHHREVRKRKPAEQDEYLDGCLIIGKDGTKYIKSLSELRADIKSKNERERLQSGQSGERRIPLTLTLSLQPDEARALDFLLRTEKQVHGQETMERIVRWLYLRGLESRPGWVDKAKEYVKSQRAKKQTNREALEAAARAKGTSPKPKESPTPPQHPAVSPAPETAGNPGDLPPGTNSPAYRAFTERCSKIVREVLSKTGEKNASPLVVAYLFAKSGKTKLADIATNQWAAVLDTLEAASADPYELLKILKTDREAAKPEPVTV